MGGHHGERTLPRISFSPWQVPQSKRVDFGNPTQREERTMSRRQDSADRGASSDCMARLVVLLLFISAGEAFGSGCQTDRSQMVALEVLPPWVFGLIVVGCPLVVLARLVWGPSPWGIQQHKEEEQTREQNGQGK